MSEEKKYFVTVGMEVHAELNTLSKMWCACKNDPFTRLSCGGFSFCLIFS